MRKTMAILLAACLLVLLGGCTTNTGDEGTPAEGGIISFGADENGQSDSKLIAFEYLFFDEDGTEHQYEILRSGQDSDAYILMHRKIGQGSISGVYLASQDVLDELAGIIRQNDIFSWNGGAEAPYFEASRIEYRIFARFENTVLEASSNFTGIPEKYAAGHEVILSFLAKQTASLPLRPIADDDLPAEAYFYLPDSASLHINLAFNRIQYTHGTASLSVPIEDTNRAGAKSFMQSLVQYYNQNMIDPLADPHANAAATLYIAREAEEEEPGIYGNKTEHTLVLPENSDWYAERVSDAFALAGLPADYEHSPTFELEMYASRFQYPWAFLYKPATFGEVVIDFVNSLVRIDGVWHTVERETLETFYGQWRQSRGGAYKPGDNLHSGQLEDGQTALGFFDSLDKESLAWAVGYTERGQLRLRGGGENTPQWEILAENLQPVLEKAVPAPPPDNAGAL